MKALSVGTLICIGADKLVMTKQAALGPIDPSVNNPLNPQINMGGNQMGRVPVSVEAVLGYLGAAKDELKITSEGNLTNVLLGLAGQVHPLVLGEIFRSRAQIRFLAGKLLPRQVKEKTNIKKIIDFLCADSGSHDYTINRREASELGLKVDTPSNSLYDLLRSIHLSYGKELELLEPYNPQVLLGVNPTVSYSLVRGLVEGTLGGCYQFVSEGTLTKSMVPGPVGPQEAITDQRTFEGWKKLP
jgi:hypothetical protein